MVFIHSGRGFEALRDHINRDYQVGNYEESWRNLSEIPQASEIWSPASQEPTRDPQERWDDYQKDPPYSLSLPHNIVEGPWPSKAKYLGAHYQILREDEIAPLRKSVKDFQAQPDMLEDKDTYIYTHVTMRGIKLTPWGAAFRVEFFTEKRIRWAQSKRLMPGNLVAISPHRDHFRSICKVAVVAARPVVGGVDLNPPQIDIFWGDPNEVVLDPDEYIMVEPRTGFFESSRHVLIGLQKAMTERFPLAEQLIDLDRNISVPEYIAKHSKYDLSSLVPPEQSSKAIEESLQNVDLLEILPEIPSSSMDASQLSALQAMLTKKLAIVQGPPGTGKTFVSVSALKVMLCNLQQDEPPIIVAAQTNHALDQLLSHVLCFEPNVLRLGSRYDKKNVAIKERTLYELKANSEFSSLYSRQGLNHALKKVATCEAEIVRVLQPLYTSSIVTAEMLLEFGIITTQQFESLYVEGWVGEHGTDAVGIESWLPNDFVVPIVRTPQISARLPLEDEIEPEAAEEMEKDTRVDDNDDEKFCLQGNYYEYDRAITGRSTGIPDIELRALLKKHRQDLHGIPVAKRGDLYRYFLKKLDSRMRSRLKSKLGEYNEAVKGLKLIKWSLNAHFISQVGIKIIGCTTTGLSKYRGLISALQPRTLLIEEAAETKEGMIIAGMIESFSHLILVGDHAQLTPHCNIGVLESEPYNMRISMFQRLVSNSLSYIMLNKQRRMNPNIRKLLTMEAAPFYRNLQDHDSTLNRPRIPGLGHMDVYFFHHNWPEARDLDSSRYNPDEAEMIAGFFRHLVFNGTEPSQITILTFYNGQRKQIVRQLRDTPGLEGVGYFRVYTIDSYQGEENDVILLSLVRSNEGLGIGFLDNKNRLVVALSRARRGLFIFGNAITLTGAETNENVLGRDPLWDPLLQHLKAQRPRQFIFDGGMPVVCQRHERTIEIHEPGDWALHAGGCDLLCRAVLPCGHLCPLQCHPFPESEVNCRMACPQKLPCGHGCSRYCGEFCSCDTCSKVVEVEPKPAVLEASNSNTIPNVQRELAIRPIVDCSQEISSKYPVWSLKKERNQVSPQFRQEVVDEAAKLQEDRKHKGVKAWKSWDAEAADSEAIAARRRQLESQLAREPTTITYNETYIPASLNEQGHRVMAKSMTSVVTTQKSNDGASRLASQVLSTAAKGFKDAARNEGRRLSSNKSSPQSKPPLSSRTQSPPRQPLIPAQTGFKAYRAMQNFKAARLTTFVPVIEQNTIATALQTSEKHGSWSITKDLLPLSPELAEVRLFSTNLSENLDPEQDDGHVVQKNVDDVNIELKELIMDPVEHCGKEAAVGVQTTEKRVATANVSADSDIGDLIDFNEPAVEVRIDRSLIPADYLADDMKSLGLL